MKSDAHGKNQQDTIHHTGRKFTKKGHLKMNTQS